MAAPVLRRLGSLVVGELVNIPLQAVIWFGVVGLPATAINVLGYIAFAIVLAEGAAYWALKRHGVRTRSASPPGIGVLAAARIPTAVFVVGAASAAIVATVTAPGSGTVPGAAFALFAVLEYVNYFHVQLAHGLASDRRRLRRRGLRESALARDIRRRRSRGGA